MEMETCYVCVLVLCTSGLVGGGTVEGLTGSWDVTVRCTDENNSKNEIQFWCNTEHLICSSMGASQEIITMYQSSIQPSGRKLVFRARREGAQNSDLAYYSCQTIDEVNTPAVSTVPDPVTKALPGSHRDTPYRNKRGIIKQAKEAEKSGSQKKTKDKNRENPPKKPQKPPNCPNKKKCSGEEDSTESTNSGGDGHGNPEGGNGGSDPEGGNGDRNAEGGDDDGVGKTEGGNGDRTAEDGDDDGDGKTEGGNGDRTAEDGDDDGKTEGGNGDRTAEDGDDYGDGKSEGGNGDRTAEDGDDDGDGKTEGGDDDRNAEGGTGGEHNGEVGDGRPDNSLVVLRSALGALAGLLLVLVVCSVHLWIKRKPQSTLKAGGAGAQGESEKKVVTVYAKATNPGNAAPQPVYNATGHIYQEILDTPQSEKKVVTVYAKATNPGNAALQPVSNATGDIYQEVEGTSQDLAEVIHNSLYTPFGQPVQEQQSGPQREPLANGQYSLLQLPVEQ